MHKTLRSALFAASSFAALAFAASGAGNGGLIFSLSGGPDADYARGAASALFQDKVTAEADKTGSYLRADDTGVISWPAAANIFAQRGTLRFKWRAREPLGAQPFALFRVGYADHSSWDMTWLRIDWNGHGIDAFVTDNGLRRIRVSYKIDKIPAADQWLDIAFSWDENQGVRLYLDGREIARKDEAAVLDAGLDQFGPHARIISPWQTQSLFQFTRGGDIKDIRIYDHMLQGESVAALHAGKTFGDAPYALDLSRADAQNAWLTRYGWTRLADPPLYLSAPDTVIRKVEFAEAIDVKQRMNNGNDGIPETTWPGVYNRSKIEGRHDYFELPDWNVYVEGGKSVTFTLPAEAWNHIEFQGPAYGTLTAIDGKSETKLAEKPWGRVRTSYDFAARKGGALRFDNVVQETPIQEIAAYDVHPGTAPADDSSLDYVVRAAADPTQYRDTAEVASYVNGRHPAGEATLAMALPDGAPVSPRALPAHTLPIVHIVIPSDSGDLAFGPVGKKSYGWRHMRDGLDGIVLEIPALKVKPTQGAYFPLDIQIKDPIWPGRNLLDVRVAVKPGEARTLFLDTRDRLLPDSGSLYLSIAGGGGDFDAGQLDGAKIRLMFKPRDAAKIEHIADRYGQIRDEIAWNVEENPRDHRFARFERLSREFASLFDADPDHAQGRLLLAETTNSAPWPDFVQPQAPKGVPLWAFRQTEELKLVHRFAAWWVDNRQSSYGDFGGGISDDDDLTHQWPPLVLMGVAPDTFTASLNALVDAVDKNKMITDGLGTIATDYLHTYEEGLNARSQAAYVDWGDPKTLERLMQTVRAYPHITDTDKRGFKYIDSQLYSGTHVVREGVWGWEHPYSYLILHPGVMLGEFNRDPTMKALVVSLADGYLARAVKNADGTVSYPEFFNGATDEQKSTLKPGTRGIAAVYQLFFTAYSWTGDEKYLAPIKALLAPKPHADLAQINPNMLGLLGHVADWGADAEKAAKGGSHNPTVLYYAWLASGDKTYLETLHADAIQADSQHMEMVTVDHWWSDRVELFSDILQRERLGGMALRRNQFYPGHLVGWRFAGKDDAENIAVLIHDPMPDSFTVEAYNLSGKPIRATMTGWKIAPGTWRMSGEGVKTKEFTFETSVGTDLVFAPKRTTLLKFERIAAGDDPASRPDIGIGAYDAQLADGKIVLTVHGLGAKDSPAGTAALLDANGKVLATAAVPPIPAPLDNLPKTVAVTLPAAPGAVSVRLSLGAVKEVTLLNNTAPLPK